MSYYVLGLPDQASTNPLSLVYATYDHIMNACFFSRDLDSAIRFSRKEDALNGAFAMSISATNCRPYEIHESIEQVASEPATPVQTVDEIGYQVNHTVEDWSDKDALQVRIEGHQGLGKTTVASIIFNVLQDVGYVAAYIPLADDTQESQNRFHESRTNIDHGKVGNGQKIIIVEG